MIQGPDTEDLIPHSDPVSRFYVSRGVCVRCQGERFVTDPETGQDIDCPRCDRSGEEPP